jgi:carbamoyltransferase
MWVLGVTSSHNGAAALIHDGRVEVAIQAERLSRRKREDTRFDRPNAPLRDCVAYCLDHAGIGHGDLGAIASCTPWEHYKLDPALLAPDAGAAAILAKVRRMSVPHHLAHAEYILHYAETDRAIVLVVDGSGSFEAQRPKLDIQERERDPLKFVEPDQKETVSAYAYDGRDLGLIYRCAESRAHASHPIEGHRQSMGHLWEWASRHILGESSEAGKVMGLAGFGNADTYRALDAMGLAADGRLEVRFERLYERFGAPAPRATAVIEDQRLADIAAHVQDRTDETLLALCRLLHGRYEAPHLCYSGGVALNGLANERVIRAGLFETVFQNGSCEDNGTAIGAAVAVHHALTGVRVAEPVTDYYGRDYSDARAAAAFARYHLPAEKLDAAGLLSRAAKAIAAGKVIGWHQGRSEFGPRALGNRSILADAANPGIKAVLDTKVKRREPYRPYAPAVPLDVAGAYFDIEGPSPVMIRVGHARDGRLPAVTHVDRTARVQTVTREGNALFHDLLRAVGRETGTPVVLNTSFNVAGEPIVETPEDAVRTFLHSGMDELYIGTNVAVRPGKPGHK